MTDQVTDANPPILQLTVLSQPENIALVRHGLAGLAERLGASPDLVDDIKTAVSEAVTNAVVHGYPESAGPVDVAACVTDRQLDVFVRDQGAGIQPRPMTEEETSLRVGLALIGALSDEFVVRGEDGGGTELRISFDLDRKPRHDVEQRVLLVADPIPGENEAKIAIRGADAGGAAIPKVLEMFVARADLSIEKLSDAHLIGDFLASWASRANADSEPLQVTISDGDGGVLIKVGPLEPGLGVKMLASSDLPGFGNTLERIADRAEVAEVKADSGPAEYLVLELRND
jgi:anti-sigma regulatory factor (Ser/Thr protein kinase)